MTEETARALKDSRVTVRAEGKGQETTEGEEGHTACLETHQEETVIKA